MSCQTDQERLNRIQSWIVGLFIVWVFAQFSVSAVYCAGIGVVDARSIESELSRAFALLFFISACPTVVASSAACVVTLWNLRYLRASWIMLGVTP